MSMQVSAERSLIRRFSGNPILTKVQVPYPVETVHNAGMIKADGHYIMVFRSHLRNGRSILGLARSQDGFRFEVDSRPFMVPSIHGVFGEYEEFGVEDPRICALNGEYLITYSAYSRHGVRIGLARTADFKSVERIALITQADYRNVVIFPQKFHDRFVRLDRPHSEISPWSIWISYSPDLIHWGDSKVVMKPVAYHWDQMKIGPGATPFRTDRGWLHIYHGVYQTMDGCNIQVRSGLTRSGRSVEDTGRSGRVDSSTRGSVGSYRLCPQRGIHLRSNPGRRRHSENLLGRC